MFFYLIILILTPGTQLIPLGLSIYIVYQKNSHSTLDSRMFGRAIILDGNSTVEHWNGSAILYDKNGNQMGTGFLEQSEFTPHDTVVLQRIEGAGLTKNDLAEFTQEVRLIYGKPFHQSIHFSTLCF